MKVNGVVVAVLAGAVAASSVHADDDQITPAVYACDQCEDLCQLVDEYLEREALIEMYRQYAQSNPQRIPLKHSDYVVGFVQMQFNEWSLTRQLPCQLASMKTDKPRPPAPPGGGGGKDEDFAIGVPADSSCAIHYSNKGSGDDARVFWEKTKNCKTSADATIEHEKVHQEQCRKAFAADPANAADTLSDPAVQAENELRAHEKHRDVLAEQIRKIVHEKNCGWNPTTGQQYSGAMPSPTQVKKMQERGWAAVQSLEGGK